MPETRSIHPTLQSDVPPSLPSDIHRDVLKDKYERFKQISIPFLPGNSVKNSFSSDYKKSHALGFKNGYPVAKDLLFHLDGTPRTQEELDQLVSQLSIPPSFTYNHKLSLLPSEQQPNFVPSFVAYDQVVLRFRAYFKQTVHDSIEPYLLRVVNLVYYLEDDSISVIEPPQQNSGILQGVLIKRQRLPKSSTEFYTLHDLNCGINVTFYGKTFRIIDCDEYTRKYMKEMFNKELAPAEPCPIDPYLSQRVKPAPTHQSHFFNDKLCKFLKFDRQVLRFYCSWEEPGFKREFILHYYLVDDCVELRELHQPNDGRDPCPLLLKRQQLPKTFHDLSDLTSGTYYTWKDLRVGGTINVLNRRMVIHNCDDFTRRFYEETLGVTMTPLNLRAPTPPRIQNPYPPYNGFGSEEDSLQSCKHLVLQPPKREFLMNQETQVFRFVAQMKSRHVEDQERKFVISFYMMDDSISIYEPPLRNSGTVGGKFLERGPVLLPGYTKQTPKYYKLTDFFIGTTLVIHSHVFQLLDADEGVYVYMESRPLQFPFACFQNVWEKIQCLKKEHQVDSLIKSIPEDKQLRQVLKQLLEPDLVLHEVITLQRHKDKVFEFHKKSLSNHPTVEIQTDRTSASDTAS